MEGAPSTLACGPEVRMTSEEKVYTLEKNEGAFVSVLIRSEK